MLLEAGAGIESTLLDGQTALHLAARYDHGETVKLLLKRGADIGTRDEVGQTPLAYTVGRRKADMLKLLLGRLAVLRREMFDKGHYTVL
jgi:ankyrin repeat protein